MKNIDKIQKYDFDAKLINYTNDLLFCDIKVIEHGLEDEQQKVRTITALGIAALAEASTPYGIESFDSVLKPLWKGIKMHRGKGLAAFLKAIGYLIPLMDAEYANYYTREVRILISFRLSV